VSLWLSLHVDHHEGTKTQRFGTCLASPQKIARNHILFPLHKNVGTNTQTDSIRVQSNRGWQVTITDVTDDGGDAWHLRVPDGPALFYGLSIMNCEQMLVVPFQSEYSPNTVIARGPAIAEASGKVIPITLMQRPYIEDDEDAQYRIALQFTASQVIDMDS